MSSLKQQFILYWVVLIAVSSIYEQSLFASPKSSTSPNPLQYLKQRLKSNRFPSTFIRDLLKNYDDSKRDQVVKLNIMGFLLSPDYSGHISEDAIKRSKSFMIDHQSALNQAEQKYGVKKEIITALLWVESRLGENHGSFHVASVFLSLLQSDHPQLQPILLADLEKRSPTPSPLLIKKTKDRAKIKGRWAIGELWSLYKIYKKNPSVLENLKGSYSGAFGLSQFLPSSYLSWAKSYQSKAQPDLYNADDATLSVAFYLYKNGYKKNKPKTYLTALYHYNRSHDYGETIIQLAQKLSSNFHQLGF